MCKMVWFDTAVVIMFVRVAILSPYWRHFSSLASAGGDTIEDLADQSS